MATQHLGVRGNYNLYPNVDFEDYDLPLPPLDIEKRPEVMSMICMVVIAPAHQQKPEVIAY